MADVFAVRAVDGGKCQVTDGRSNEARTQCFFSRQTFLQNSRGFPAQDGYAVPGLLSVGDGVVSRSPQLGVRESVILNFKLLKPDDIRLTSLQPVKQEIKARPEPVDIPGCNAHVIAESLSNPQEPIAASGALQYRNRNFIILSAASVLTGCKELYKIAP